MGSVKHTVSVKCVQVDRSGRGRRAAGSATGSTWRRDSEEREAGQPPAKHATRRAQRLPRRTAKATPYASRWDAPP
ncbi:hypothetical protein A33K_14431 [Burkholderia humptydooensis MSMB43]|uniref:Uncharacterized protein n=1 Tax=Burkholderia humptydooensis MSMB43 TaxID=441157 RepID=A0ABN0G7S5_9BURK|nr:hypothetical protein A33K_14431 [Burkholderia humptydooensis MSMB43]